MTKKTVHARNVDAQAWLDFKGEAVRRGLEVGPALEQAIKKWTDKKRGEMEDSTSQRTRPGL